MIMVVLFPFPRKYRIHSLYFIVILGYIAAGSVGFIDGLPFQIPQLRHLPLPAPPGIPSQSHEGCSIADAQVLPAARAKGVLRVLRAARSGGPASPPLSICSYDACGELLLNARGRPLVREIWIAQNCDG